MSTASRQKLYSFEDFCAMIRDDEKADLIDGVIYVASPENTGANELAGWLYALLLLYAKKKKLGKVYFSRVAYRINDMNGPEPDVSFLCNERLSTVRRGRIDGPPDAAFEVVSPESVQRDYLDKRRQYEEAGVGEYWIVDELQRRVTLLRLGRDGTYKEVKPRRGILASKVITGFWLRPAWLWQQELPDPDGVLQEIMGGLPK